MQKKYYFILFLFGMLVSCQSPEQTPSQPNILWIIAEDLSQDLGCYGNSLVKTPHLDGLAERGVRFTHAFTAAPVCTPSRTALAVGMYQTSINAHHMRYPDSLKNELPEEVIPLTELMRRQGYITANIKDGPGSGKTDWSFKSELAPYDVSSWDDLSNDQPFFAVTNLRHTHRAFEKDTLHPIDPNEVEVPPYYPDHAVSRKDWGEYLESLQILDRQVGEVLDEVAKRGFADNTIVFFFSDHGRPMSRGKCYHYDSGYRIPLIIAAPDGMDIQQYLPKNTVDNRLVSAIDFTATAHSLGGGKKPSWMQGKVFLGEQTETERDMIFCAVDRTGETFFKTRSVRTRQFKYIRNFNHEFSVNATATAYRKAMHPIYHLLNIYDEKGLLTPAQKAMVEPMPEELLFDLENDPFEINNLANRIEHQETLQQMRDALTQWQEETNDHGMNPDSEVLEKAFEEYGKGSFARYEKKIKKMEESVRQEVEASN